MKRLFLAVLAALSMSLAIAGDIEDGYRLKEAAARIAVTGDSS